MLCTISFWHEKGIEREGHSTGLPWMLVSRCLHDSFPPLSTRLSSLRGLLFASTSAARRSTSCILLLAILLDNLVHKPAVSSLQFAVPHQSRRLAIFAPLSDIGSMNLLRISSKGSPKKIDAGLPCWRVDIVTEDSSEQGVGVLPLYASVESSRVYNESNDALGSEDWQHIGQIEHVPGLGTSVRSLGGARGQLVGEWVELIETPDPRMSQRASPDDTRRGRSELYCFGIEWERSETLLACNFKGREEVQQQSVVA